MTRCTLVAPLHVSVTYHPGAHTKTLNPLTFCPPLTSVPDKLTALHFLTVFSFRIGVENPLFLMVSYTLRPASAGSQECCIYLGLKLHKFIFVLLSLAF